jgi:hypothetical protein
MNNYLVLPYVPDMTHDSERVFRKFDIQIAYDSSGKLGIYLAIKNKKKTLDMEKSGIYIIKFKKCGTYYIGQYKRRIGERLQGGRMYKTFFQDWKEGYIESCLDQFLNSLGNIK